MADWVALRVSRSRIDEYGVARAHFCLPETSAFSHSGRTQLNNAHEDNLEPWQHLQSQEVRLGSAASHIWHLVP